MGTQILTVLFTHLGKGKGRGERRLHAGLLPTAALSSRRRRPVSAHLRDGLGALKDWRQASVDFQSPGFLNALSESLRLGGLGLDGGLAALGFLAAGGFAELLPVRVVGITVAA